MEKNIKSIKRASNIGLWGSVAIVISASVFFFSPVHFTALSYTKKWTMIVTSIMIVLAVLAVMLVVRKQIPRLRQSEDGLEAKLRGYANHIKSIYYTMLAVVAISCVLAAISDQSQLLMFVIIAVLMLFLAYPNMYRIKVDLGLNDEEMKSLFGEQYIPDNNAE